MSIPSQKPGMAMNRMARERAMLSSAVGLDRAHDADGQSHQPRHDQGEDADLRADGAAMQDEIGDGVTPEERLAELARGDVAEPVHVLHGEGVGEPQIVHDAHAILFRHSRVALHPEDGHERIAGQDAQDDEDDQ